MTDLTLLTSNSSFIAKVLPSLDRTMPGMLADLDWHCTPYGKMPVMFVRLYWHSSVGANYGDTSGMGVELRTITFLKAPSAQFDDGVKSALFIRCIKHRTIPQQNESEASGGECLGCFADTLRAEVLALCYEIEKLPASEQQTKCSIAASAIAQRLQSLTSQ